MNYDYLDNMVNDILDYIKENEIDINEVSREELYETLWIEDSVTGNGSGSYTFNTYEARENLQDNEDLLQACIDMYCIDMNEHWCDYEYLDVSIRCSLLDNAIDSVYNIIENEL